MARYDFSETEWCFIAPLLPNKPRGVHGWMTGASSMRSFMF